MRMGGVTDSHPVDDQSSWAVRERRDARPHIHYLLAKILSGWEIVVLFIFIDDDFVDLRIETISSSTHGNVVSKYRIHFQLGFLYHRLTSPFD